MTGAKIGGKPFKTQIRVSDLYNARSNGWDLGDLDNGSLQRVAVNYLDAVECAFWVYQERLERGGISTLDQFAAIDPDEMHGIIEAFREGLCVFFPVLPAILAELEKAIAEAAGTSGLTSGQPQES